MAAPAVASGPGPNLGHSADRDLARPTGRSAISRST